MVEAKMDAHFEILCKTEQDLEDISSPPHLGINLIVEPEALILFASVQKVKYFYLFLLVTIGYVRINYIF